MIRDNGKQIFEARYLKEVMKAKMGATSYQTPASSFMPSVPVLPTMNHSFVCFSRGFPRGFLPMILHPVHLFILFITAFHDS